MLRRSTRKRTAEAKLGEMSKQPAAAARVTIASQIRQPVPKVPRVTSSATHQGAASTFQPIATTPVVNIPGPTQGVNVNDGAAALYTQAHRDPVAQTTTACEPESGYQSLPTTPAASPGMQVSMVFRGNCKKKVRENFRFIKLQIIQHIDLVIDEIRATGDRLSEQKFYEIAELQGRLRKTEGLLKHLLRKGEDHCKCLLKSLQSEDIKKDFVLEDLRQRKDKSKIQPRSDYNISIKAIQECHDLICEELEISDVLDPLFEYYVISLDDHDSITYTCYKDKPRIEKNKTLLQSLFNKAEEDWICGFVHVLDTHEHKPLLSQINQSASVENVTVHSATTYTMSIKVTGLNAQTIERQLAKNVDIDNLCREFTKLTISNIRHGSVLLMVHPITPDVWGKCTSQRKQELLTDFVRQLLESSDVKRLISKTIDVAIEINEVQNVFGDPAWRVSKISTRKDYERRFYDNWTYMLEELEVEKILNHLLSNGKMTQEEKCTILDKTNSLERTKLFLGKLKDELTGDKLEDLIESLKATNQLNIATRLQADAMCIDCLRSTYMDADNYRLILEEMVSSIMLKTVARFEEDQIPHHIRTILTPACGRPRKERAHTFMQYVLLNDDVLSSFENVLAVIEFVELNDKTCHGCTPGISREDSFTIPSHLIEDVGKIQCSFTVQRHSDNDLSVTLSTPGKKHTFVEKLGKPDEQPSFAQRTKMPEDKHTFTEKQKQSEGKHASKENEERRSESHAHATEEIPREKQTYAEEKIPEKKHAHADEKIPEKKHSYAEEEKTHGSGLHHGLPSEPFIKEKQEHSSMVMAIDFGTTYSGFAFSMRDKKERIIYKKWHCSTGTGSESLKTPTTILLTPDKQFMAFGYDAEEKYQDLCSRNEHETWHYFSHFKMELHSSEILTRNTMIRDSMGNSFKAFDIFTMSISYLKQEAWKLLMEYGYKVNAEEISWIITVPAIWRDAAKQFMREAAVEASISPQHLMLALEPEVASVYFKGQDVERKGEDKISKCSPGEQFMIVDIGGGTTDITVMECTDDGRMKQISMASGGPVGGQTVNNLVFKFLNGIFGDYIMEIFKISNPYDFQKLSHEIEISKRSLKKGDKLHISLPLPLTEIYEGETGQIFKRSVKLDDRYKMKGSNKMVINEKVTEGFLSEVVSEIKSYIELTLSGADKISMMVVVGGFAECPLLHDALLKAYTSMKVIIPNDAGLAVLKGAVMYGHEPSCVAMRKCNRTYGTKAYRTFLSDDFLDKKVVQGKSIYCKDSFNKLVEIGEYINIDETRTTEIQPLRGDMSKMSVELYCSTATNPRYTTDETCTLLGKIVVDIPQKWRSRDTNVIVSMTFGKTEIIVEGREEHSQEPVTTKIDFLAG